MVNGFSDGEIAAMLGVSRQAVNKQINKIKKKLKTISDFKEKSY
ncbi:HTH domain-containing protein [Clostridium sp. MD294]